MSALDGYASSPLRNHTIMNIFPSCYVQGVVREVERRAIDHLHEINLNDLLTELDLPELSAFPRELSL